MIGLVEPEIRGHGAFHTTDARVSYGGELALLRRHSMLVGGAEHNVFTNEEWIRSTLDKTALDLGAAGRDPYYGYGLVQAKAAYDRIRTMGCSN